MEIFCFFFTGKKPYIVIAVSVGLLCVIQAVLNISLRLSLTCSGGTEEILKNRTNEGESKNVTIKDESKSVTNKDESKNLTNERDELRQKMKKYGYLFLIVLLEVYFLLLTTFYQKEWQYLNGSLYYVSTTTANWQESRNDCLSKGADLVVINDAAENVSALIFQVLTNDFARGFGKRVWLGLYKNGSSWRWVDGSYLTISFWDEGEPNNDKDQEDRVEMAAVVSQIRAERDTCGKFYLLLPESLGRR
ncbi:C-type lectin domain family 4 member M-like [Oryzias melastigma]|uniref:C-type lectin domain family 4 member M-like n=1 Tax=Oryzias melastigma TaxID=30732 RepID=UPI00168D2335|nr:C-type lectin domain family 4 member M-like [Oryzias melastigma]